VGRNGVIFQTFTGVWENVSFLPTGLKKGIEQKKKGSEPSNIPY
jgi:hypothetical protein